MESSGPLNTWTKQETLKLIDEYKKHSVLYNSDHPDYIKSHKKREAFLAIVKVLKDIKPNVNEVLVKTKLKTLRHQLACERKKIICAKKNGSSSAHCKPTLWCYDELSFLLRVNTEPAPAPASSSTRINNLELLNESQFDEQASRDESEHFILPKKVRQETEMETFQRTINKSMEIMEKISTTTKLPSKEEAFCHYLSTELRALKLEESFDEFKMSAMILLQNVKANEKKTLSENNSVWRNSLSPSAEAAASASPSIPLSFKYVTRSASSSGYSGYAECSSNKRRRESSSAGSVLNETVKSSSNDFDECDDEFPTVNEHDVKCEPVDDF